MYGVYSRLALYNCGAYVIVIQCIYITKKYIFPLPSGGNAQNIMSLTLFLKQWIKNTMNAVLYWSFLRQHVLPSSSRGKQATNFYRCTTSASARPGWIFNNIVRSYFFLLRIVLDTHTHTHAIFMFFHASKRSNDKNKLVIFFIFENFRRFWTLLNFDIFWKFEKPHFD